MKVYNMTYRNKDGGNNTQFEHYLHYVISMIIITSGKSCESPDDIDFIFCDLVIHDDTRETHRFDLSILKVLTYLRKLAREKKSAKGESEYRVIPIYTDVGCGNKGVEITVVPYNVNTFPNNEILIIDNESSKKLINSYLADKVVMDDKRIKISRMLRTRPKSNRLRLNNGNWFTGYGGTHKKSKSKKSRNKRNNRRSQSF